MGGDFEAFGHEFFDLNFKFADGRCLGIAIGGNAPFSGCRRRRYRNIHTSPAKLVGGIDSFKSFFAIGLIHHDGDGQNGIDHGLIIAQQIAQFDTFARTIDAAFGIQICLQRFGRRFARNTMIR